jgi:hypothetical protein
MTDLVEPEGPADPARPWEVWVNQPFHLTGEAERYRVGAFATCEEARQACQHVIDGFVESRMPAFGGAAELFSAWKESGPEPWIQSHAADQCLFSATDYARERCAEVFGPPPRS